MLIIDHHFDFLFLPFLQVIQRPATSSGLSSAVSSITPRNFTHFRSQTSKGAFAKGRYDICFACGKTGHWRVNCPNLFFTAGSTYKQIQSLPSKESGFPLGGSSFIAANKAVKETLEGISDDGPPFEECFEFENSPNSIQPVKGRLKAHFSFLSIPRHVVNPLCLFPYRVAA